MKLDDVVLVATLQSMITYHKKRYCYPSQNTLLKILKNNWRISICRRTLNYHLRKLEEMRYIKRFKAHYQDKITKKLVFRTTRYYVLIYAERLTNTYLKVAENIKRFSRVQLFAQYLLTNNKNLRKVATKTPASEAKEQKCTSAWSEPPDQGFKETFLRLKKEILEKKRGR